MSGIMSILVCMLLTLVIVLTAIIINNKLNKAEDLIIRVMNGEKKQIEHFPTPNESWREAATFTNKPNYLLTTAQNKIYTTNSPSLIPGTNMKGTAPFNEIAGSKSQMYIKDANNVNGIVDTMRFPGPKNYTTIRAKNTEKNTVQIAGADIKDDKVIHNPESAVVVQKGNVAAAEEGKDMTDVPFSPNPRMNSTEAASLTTPTTTTATEEIKQTFRKSYKNGKF